jgi:DNA-binding PadR family transcriptional regulator
MDVRTLCLGVLSTGDATGYEIKKQAEEGPYAHFFRAGFGSIYPALAKLARDGLIAGRAQTQDGKPDKRIYSITSAGRRELVLQLGDVMSSQALPDVLRSDFMMLLFYAHLVDRQRIGRQIDAQHDWYQAGADRCRQRRAEDTGMLPGHRFVCGLGQAIYQAAADYLKDSKASFLAELAPGDRQAAE